MKCGCINLDPAHLKRSQGKHQWHSQGSSEWWHQIFCLERWELLLHTNARETYNSKGLGYKCQHSNPPGLLRESSNAVFNVSTWELLLGLISRLVLPPGSGFEGGSSGSSALVQSAPMAAAQPSSDCLSCTGVNHLSSPHDNVSHWSWHLAVLAGLPESVAWLSAVRGCFQWDLWVEGYWLLYALVSSLEEQS